MFTPKATLSPEEVAAVRNMVPNALLLTIHDAQGNALGSLQGSWRTFSTGSSGYYFSGKVSHKGHERAVFQIGCNMTLVGSSTATPAERQKLSREAAAQKVGLPPAPLR